MAGGGSSEDTAVLPRLFIAVWPSTDARAALTEALESARAGAPELAEVRWQPPDRWHVTLAFLGRRDPEAVGARIDRLVARPGLPGAGPVRMSGVGTFGPVVWVGVDHGPWLSGLAAALQRQLRTEDHHFRAHITIGRMRGAAAPRRAREAAASLPGLEGPDWTPHEFTLVASQTGPKPHYSVLASWHLRGDGR